MPGTRSVIALVCCIQELMGELCLPFYPPPIYIHGQEMKLESIAITPGSFLPDSHRLTARVSFDRHDWGDEELWFEVPSHLREELSDTGNPWLLCLLPLAMSAGEDLDIPLPIDAVLFRNTEELVRILRCWFPHLHPVSIRVRDIASRNPRPERQACFFTGGVDSFFTILHHDDSLAERTLPGERPLDDLLYVVGLDVLLGYREVFQQRIETLTKASTDLGRNFIVMATNLRETRLETLDYSSLWHGTALGAAGLVLEKRFGTILISSSQDYRNPVPWGSHMCLDPLFSTDATRFVHYGSGYSRYEKTERVARSSTILGQLLLCWQHGSRVNCGRCEKCFRTLLALDILGKLDQATLFDLRHYSVQRARRLKMADIRSAFYLEEIRQAALEHGRRDIVDAMTDCLEWNHRIHRFETRMTQLARVPGLRTLSRPLRKAGRHIFLRKSMQNMTR